MEGVVGGCVMGESVEGVVGGCVGGAVGGGVEDVMGGCNWRNQLANRESSNWRNRNGLSW